MPKLPEIAFDTATICAWIGPTDLFVRKIDAIFVLQKGDLSMPASEFNPQKRSYPRFCAMSAAMVVNTAGVVFHCAVENFSPGGAKLIGQMDLALGERVRLLLQLPGRTPFSLQGTIVRWQDRARVPTEGHAIHSYGIAFDEAASRTQATGFHAANIESVLGDLAMQQKTSQKLVLVFDTKQQNAALLTRDLQAAGLGTITVGTALDAIQWLLDSHTEFGAVVIASDGPVSNQAELHQFLDEEYPHIPKIMVEPTTVATQPAARNAILSQLRPHLTQKSAVPQKP